MARSSLHRLTPSGREYDLPLIQMGLIVAIAGTLFLLFNLDPRYYLPLIAGGITLLVGLLGRWGRRTRTALVASCLVAIVGPLAYRAWDSRLREPVLFVVEEGFNRSSVALVEDPENGVEIPIEDGIWIVRVPPSGRLRIKDRSMFAVPHVESCQFSNGDPCRMGRLSWTTYVPEATGRGLFSRDP